MRGWDCVLDENSEHCHPGPAWAWWAPCFVIHMTAEASAPYHIHLSIWLVGSIRDLLALMPLTASEATLIIPLYSVTLVSSSDWQERWIPPVILEAGYHGGSQTMRLSSFLLSTMGIKPRASQMLGKNPSTKLELQSKPSKSIRKW